MSKAVAVLCSALFLTIAAHSQTPPAISAGGIVNAASYAAGAISPGEIIVIFGSNLGPATLTAQQPTAAGFGTSLSTVQVLIGGIAAPILYVSSNQIGVVAPYEIAGMSQVDVSMTYQGETSNTVMVPVAATQLGLFSADSSGTGGGAILNPSYQAVTSSNPAAPGDIVSLFGTGEGVSNPKADDGSIDPNPAPRPVASITAMVGGMPANVLYAGGSPGLVAGLLQTNIEIPSALVNCAAAGAPVVITSGTQSSQANLMIPMKVASSCPPNLMFSKAVINGNVTVKGLGTYSATVGVNSNLDGTYTTTLLALLPIDGLNLLFPSSTITGDTVNGGAPNAPLSTIGGSAVSAATFTLTITPEAPLGGVTFVTATGTVTATSANGAVSVTGMFNTTGMEDGFIQ